MWYTDGFLCRRLQRTRMRRQQWIGNGTDSKHHQRGSSIKIKSTKEVIQEAQRTEAQSTGHPRGVFVTLMYICHLENSEKRSKFQQNERPVVLREDTVKDDSWTFSVVNTNQRKKFNSLNPCSDTGRMNTNQKIQINFADINDQLADVLTKGSFKRDERNHLLSRNDFWLIQRDLIYRHRAEPRVQFIVSKKETFLFPLNEVHSRKSGYDVRDAHRRSLERRWDQEFIRFFERIHKMY